MDYTKFLPLEITIDVLTRLPIESVLDCKLVCKAWKNAVRHPTFFNIHLDRLNRASTDSGMLSFIALTNLENYKFQYFEYNENDNNIQRITRFKFTPPSREFNLLGSFNGLICYLDYHYPCSVCICNPITKEHVILPQIRANYSDVDGVPEYGFGYISSTNEYKVVGVYMLNKTKFVEVCIYSLGSGLGWRNLGNFSPEFRINPWDPVIFANEALYWINRESEMIVTFDLAEEKFCENLSPPPLQPDSNWEIGVVDGFLYFGNYLVDEEEDECCDIWLLKEKNDNYDMEEGETRQSFGWCREFRIDESKLLAVTKSEGVLTYIGNSLSIYDTEASTSKTLVDFTDQICRVCPHKNTLVSLKDLGEERCD